MYDIVQVRSQSGVHVNVICDLNMHDISATIRLPTNNLSCRWYTYLMCVWTIHIMYYDNYSQGTLRHKVPMQMCNMSI